MTRRQFVKSSVVLSFVLVSKAQSNDDDEMLENVYADAVRWFKALFRPLNELATVIDKNRLLSYLRNLGNSFEAMLRDKQEIVSLLNRKPPLVDDLQQIARRLELNVRLCSERVTRVSFLLKEQYKNQGERIASELSETLGERKNWLRDLERSGGIASENELAIYAKKAKSSAAALSLANAELAKLVQFIASQP